MRAFDFCAAGRIGRTVAALKHTRCGQDLCAVADRGNRFACREEMPDHLDNARVHAQIFRGAAAGNDERVVVCRIDFGEGRVQRKIMARFLRIGLMAFEVMNRGRDRVAGVFVRTYRIDLMADGQKRLERHHDFIVFAKITANHQNAFRRHVVSSQSLDKWRILHHRRSIP